MAVMVQIRDVPDDVHGTLKARAAREHMSLSDFLKRELERIASRPSMEEWVETVRRIKPVAGSESGAQIIRRLRDSR